MRRKKTRKPLKQAGTIKIGKQRRGIIFLSRPSTLSIIFSSLAITLLVAGLTIGGIPVIWMGWYRLSPGTSTALAQILRRPIVGFGHTLTKEGVAAPEPYQPPFDPSLPAENRLIIPKLAMDTPIVEAPPDQYEDAFRKGVWRTPEGGTPFERSRPTVLAAHRFGYLNWTVQYRLKNSFYNLPKVGVGDRVEMIWGQRRYLYEVYAEEEGKDISQYTADLILYTCKFLETDIRIFKYARLIEKGYFDLTSSHGTPTPPKPYNH